MSVTTLSAPRPIQLLPRQLANQIAAGEVVERPASVVKELLENSIDADADRIDVMINRGGLSEITVRDNGCGIPAEELPLALSRHATSKVSNLAELENILSMGFRGEALASIGSVSQLRITSRLASEEQAWQVAYQTEELSRPQPASHPVGTSVEVKELFYNTPARRKFMRTERTEFRYVDEVFRHMALGQFHIAMTLRHNGRTVHQLATAKSENAMVTRVAKLCGKSFMDSAVRIEVNASGLKIWGWLSRPEFSRSQNDLQHFFVNGRIVRDRLIQHAIRQAYDELLPTGRYPGLVLYLELEPNRVDVNVHPTKHEVRFREARLVHDFIYSSLRKGLGQDQVDERVLAEAYIAEQSRHYRAFNRPVRVYDNTTSSDKAGRGQAVSQHEQNTPLGRPLAILHNQFLLAQYKDGLVMVDITRAQDKILLRLLRDAFHGEGIVAQPLLIPIGITVTEVMANFAEQYQPVLQHLGIELDRIGPQSLLLRMFPALLREADKVAVITLLLEQLADIKAEPSAEEWRMLLAGMAATGANVADLNWSVQQMQTFLHTVYELNDPSLWTCLSSEQIRNLINPAQSSY